MKLMTIKRRQLDTEGFTITYSNSKRFFEALGFEEVQSRLGDGSIGKILLPEGWMLMEEFKSNDESLYFIYDLNDNVRGKVRFYKQYITPKLYKRLVNIELFTRFSIKKTSSSLVLTDRDCSHSRRYYLPLSGFSEEQISKRLTRENNILLNCFNCADEPTAYWGLPVSLKSFFEKSKSHWTA